MSAAPLRSATARLSSAGLGSFERRSFLQLGALACVGSGSSQTWSGGPGTLTSARRRDTACIVFFLDGGPSHLDTLDPKPAAPREVRGDFGVIDTEIPGVALSEQLPLLSQRAKLYALIRSLYHASPSHAPAEHQMLTGWLGSRPGTARAVIERPSLGSVVSRLRGPRRLATPAYVAIPWSFHHAYGGSPFGAAAYLGAPYEPFESGPLPSSAVGDFRVRSLTLPGDIPTSRLRHRHQLLATLDRPTSQAAPQRLQQLSQTAFSMLDNPRLREAFDLGREQVALRQKYGAHPWGQGALLARRLVEAGVTFTMMQCGLRQDWDTHQKNFTTLKNKLLPPLDRAVAALLDDLRQRGLLEKTLVMVIGEFGRTPRIGEVTSNNTTDDSGRDHWSRCFSALVAGGGIAGGQVVGASDRMGGDPQDRPVHAQDLFATMYHLLGIDYHTLFSDAQERPIPVLADGQPIRELLS